MTNAQCDTDPITGECATHPDCYGRPLGPLPTTVPESTRTIFDLPIAGWAWGADGRDTQS